jgi:hypothetical protein
MLAPHRGSTDAAQMQHRGSTDAAQMQHRGSTDATHAVICAAPTLDAANTVTVCGRRPVWPVLLQARDNGGDAHEKVLD